VVEDRRLATVAIVGLPNSGKSTLLNAIIGEKIAAVSQMPQTTRGKILGVLNRGIVQLAFLDTPGVHTARHILNKRMLHHIDIALDEADLVLWVVDASGFLGQGELELARRLSLIKQPVYLILNKVDVISSGSLLEKIVAYKDLLIFSEIVPMSAKFGHNLSPLLELLERDARCGEWIYEGDIFTNQTEREMATEFIREKVLRKTREEVPHGVAVEILSWVDNTSDGNADGHTVIEAEIIVERAGHRKILLGSGGATIRGIRQSSQRELKKLLQCPVRLALHVKVKENWRDRPDQLDRLRL
jgi:GTP-binding protein Era